MVAENDRWFVGAIVGTVAVVLTLWAGAASSSVLSHGHVPPLRPMASVQALVEHRGNPSAAWGQPMGSASLYWSTTALVAIVLTVLAVAAVRVARAAGQSSTDVANRDGLATRREVTKAAGKKALLTRARTLRPSLAKPDVGDVGIRVGRSNGVDCYSSVEDSIVLLGPPRSGKGLHVVINALLDAPGAVVTTSTRPDNLTATLTARSRRGPVAVFDPQGLAPAVPSATKWSPIRGCESAQVALVRAKALTTGAARGTTDASFWQSAAEQAVRCLLHAAALGGKSSQDLYRWSLSAPQAREAVTILATHPDAAGSWHQALEAIVSSDQRQRDSVWAMVTIAFASLADPRVLGAVSPGRVSSSTPRSSCASAAACTCSAPPPVPRPPRDWSQRSSRTWRSPRVGWQPPPRAQGWTHRWRWCWTRRPTTRSRR